MSDVQRIDVETGRGKEIVAETEKIGTVAGTLRDWFEDGSANIFMTNGAFRGMVTHVKAGKWQFADASVPDGSVVREKLSNVSHDIWSHWMRWMFAVGTFNADGSWTMPPALAERWKRQMETPYADLTEREKDSDREQADKILDALG